MAHTDEKGLEAEIERLRAERDRMVAYGVARHQLAISGLRGVSHSIGHVIGLLSCTALSIDPAIAEALAEYDRRAGAGR